MGGGKFVGRASDLVTDRGTGPSAAAARILPGKAIRGGAAVFVGKQ